MLEAIISIQYQVDSYRTVFIFEASNAGSRIHGEQVSLAFLRKIQTVVIEVNNHPWKLMRWSVLLMMKLL